MISPKIYILEYKRLRNMVRLGRLRALLTLPGYVKAHHIRK